MTASLKLSFGGKGRGEGVLSFKGNHNCAFTLIELLVVIAIIGILAVVGLPAIKGMTKSNATISATRQLLDDVAFARRSAIANHTTVYMVFVPTNVTSTTLFPGTGGANSTVDSVLTNLYTKQFTTYAIVAARTVGDQPGLSTPRYLTDWRSLPNGVFIEPAKFAPYRPQVNGVNVSEYVRGFSCASTRTAATNLAPNFPNIPFPAVGGSYTTNLPFIGFDYLGRLTSPYYESEAIPLARGSIFYDSAYNPDVLETPMTNSLSESNVIHIDWLTGRARLERQEIQ